jgi:hypothetical protein
MSKQKGKIRQREIGKCPSGQEYRGVNMTRRGMRIICDGEK